jgi:outer membrane lipoprotein SlyB
MIFQPLRKLARSMLLSLPKTGECLERVANACRALVAPNQIVRQQNSASSIDMEQKNKLLVPLAILAVASIIAFSSIGIAAITGHLPISQPSLNTFGSYSQPNPVQLTQVATSPAHQGLTRVSGENRATGKTVDFRRGVRVAAKRGACDSCGIIDSISPIVQSSSSEEQQESASPDQESADAASSGGKRFLVIVRMEDGTIRTIRENQQPSFDVGERVRLVNGSIIPIG